MGMTPDQYLSQLQALLPLGAAWPRHADSDMTRLLSALAQELARIDARAEKLIDEIDPRTTSELLLEWEAIAGLPDPCTGPLDTLQARRLALITKIANLGGQSRAFFIALAATLGYTITIDEKVDGLPHKWRVNAPAVTIRTFKAGRSRAGDPLRDWGNALLECAITRLKPAHTTVVFGYGD